MKNLITAIYSLGFIFGMAERTLHLVHRGVHLVFHGLEKVL